MQKGVALLIAAIITIAAIAFAYSRFATGTSKSAQSTTTSVAATSMASTSAPPTQASTAASTTASTTVQSGQPLPTDIWTFNENGGTMAADSGPGGNNGTLINSPMWINGRYGSALGFDGSSQYVLAKRAGISGTNARTYSAWVKTTACSHPVCDIMTYGSESVGRRIEWSVEGNAVGLRIWTAYIVYNATGIADGNWHLVTAVVPQSAALNDISLYVDGKKLTYVNSEKDPTTQINTGTDNPINIGRMYSGASVMGTVAPNGAAYFNGAIDDLRIYSSALSQSDIQALYNSAG